MRTKIFKSATIAALIFILSGCALKQPAVVPSMGYIEGNSFEIYYRAEDKELAVSFKNKLQEPMGNLLLSLSPDTGAGYTETQYMAGNLPSEDIYYVTIILPHNFTGGVTITYYYSLSNAVADSKVFKSGSVSFFVSP